jgi:hypothetical protein
MDEKQQALAELEKRGALKELQRRGLISKGPRSIEATEEDWTPRQIAQFGRNAAAGVGDIADLPIMAANYGLRKAGSEYQIPHVGDKIAHKIDTLSNQYTAPRNKGERIGESATRGLISLLSGNVAGKALAKAPGILSKFGKGLAAFNEVNPTTALATTTGAAASRAAIEHDPENISKAIAAGILPDLLLRGGRGLISKRNISNVADINPETIKNFKTLGVSPTLGQASNSGVLKTFEKALENIPIINKPIRTLRNKQNEAIRGSLGPGAENTAMTELEAGKLAHKNLETHGDRISNKAGRLRAKVLDKVQTAPSDLIDVGNSLNFFKQLKESVKTGTMEKLIEKSPFGKEAERLEKMATINGGKVPFSDVEALRTHLLDEITKKEAGSITRGRLEHLRGLLNKDIQPYMQSIGANEDWTRYNKFYSNYATYRKPHVVQASEIPVLEAHKVFDSIGHSGKLDRPLLESIYASSNKNDQKQIMNSLVQKMGKKGDNWEPGLFARRFIGQPKETQDLFLKPLSAPMRDKFKAVIGSIEAIKDTNAFANTSRTAYTQQLLNVAKVGASALPSLALGQDMGDSVWQGALLLAAGRAATRGLIANPKFIEWAYKGSQLKNPRAKIHHIEGIKGVLGVPVYQEIKNALSAERLDSQ